MRATSPCSGFGQRRPLPKGGKHRIAVIGGGIAGVGCAYTLVRSGYDVTIYEARDRLGGNAHRLQLRSGLQNVCHL